MNKGQEKIITRFAPSPTGNLHIGSARTALFNYLYTKKHGGKMILRIEDTDEKRSKKEYEDDIIEGLAWLGIEWTGNDTSPNMPYRQSERTPLYTKYIKQLIDSGGAYVSEEEKEGKPSNVIRFKNSNKKITFNDKVRGDITFDTTDLGDFVIAKDMENPLYHLAVVVDDFDMGVTHVIRGEDGISNTPRQILIQEAIGAPRPIYAHIPLILAPDKSKLSKRHGAVSVNEFRKEGYLRDAVINFLVLLGWSPQAAELETDILSLEELFKVFSLEHIQKSGAIFNQEKLDSLNRAYIKKMDKKELEKCILERLPYKDTAIAKKIIPLVLERIHTFKDIETLSEKGEFSYFFSKPEYNVEKLNWKETPPKETSEHLEHISRVLSDVLEKDFHAKTLKDTLWEYAGEHGRGSVFWPLRYALSGREKSSDPFTIAEIIGKKETLSRINSSIGIVRGMV